LEEKGLGPFGTGERNERGKRLLDFVSSRNLFIGNTLFKKSPKNTGHGRAQMQE
jgi:hypothetical protein